MAKSLPDIFVEVNLLGGTVEHLQGRGVRIFRLISFFLSGHKSSFWGFLWVDRIASHTYYKKNKKERQSIPVKQLGKKNFGNVSLRVIKNPGGLAISRGFDR
jgi:hypothetical protein